MLRLLLAFVLLFTTVSVKFADYKTMTKVGLAELKAIEEMRIQHRFAERVSKGIYKNIVAAAKVGQHTYAAEFEGCNDTEYLMSAIQCEKIIKIVFSNINSKFPDSVIHYDVNNKTYYVDWFYNQTEAVEAVATEIPIPTPADVDAVVASTTEATNIALDNTSVIAKVPIPTAELDTAQAPVPQTTADEPTSTVASLTATASPTSAPRATINTA